MASVGMRVNNDKDDLQREIEAGYHNNLERRHPCEIVPYVSHVWTGNDKDLWQRNYFCASMQWNPRFSCLLIKILCRAK